MSEQSIYLQKMFGNILRQLKYIWERKEPEYVRTIIQYKNTFKYQ